MGDRIDARVIRVHEALPRLDRAHALLDQADGGVPTREPGPAQVRGVKPVSRNSVRVTTGTSRPRNGAYRCTSFGSGTARGSGPTSARR